MIVACSLGLRRALIVWVLTFTSTLTRLPLTPPSLCIPPAPLNHLLPQSTNSLPLTLLLPSLPYLPPYLQAKWWRWVTWCYGFWWCGGSLSCVPSSVTVTGAVWELLAFSLAWLAKLSLSVPMMITGWHTVQPAWCCQADSHQPFNQLAMPLFTVLTGTSCVTVQGCRAERRSTGYFVWVECVGSWCMSSLSLRQGECWGVAYDTLR